MSCSAIIWSCPIEPADEMLSPLARRDEAIRSLLRNQAARVSDFARRGSTPKPSDCRKMRPDLPALQRAGFIFNPNPENTGSNHGRTFEMGQHPVSQGPSG